MTAMMPVWDSYWNKETENLYNRAEPQRITEDLLGYIVQLHDQRAIDF